MNESVMTTLVGSAAIITYVSCIRSLSLSLSLSLAGGNIVALLAGMFVCFSTDSTVYISVNIYSVMFVTYLWTLSSQNSRQSVCSV